LAIFQYFLIVQGRGKVHGDFARVNESIVEVVFCLLCRLLILEPFLSTNMPTYKAEATMGVSSEKNFDVGDFTELGEPFLELCLGRILRNVFDNES